MMIVTKTHLPRRTFLRGLGASIALPLLDSMVPALTALSKTAAATVRHLGIFCGADDAQARRTVRTVLPVLTGSLQGGIRVSQRKQQRNDCGSRRTASGVRESGRPQAYGRRKIQLLRGIFEKTTLSWTALHGGPLVPDTFAMHAAGLVYCDRSAKPTRAASGPAPVATTTNCRPDRVL